MGLTRSIAAGVALDDHRPDGASGAPLVLVHGAGGTRAHWPEEVRRLPGRRVLSLDLPGHGASPLPAEGSIPALGARVLRVLDALGIDRAVVGGHSMGGAVALWLALEAPARVAGLLLVGTGARLRVAPAVLAATADPARHEEAARLMAEVSFGPRSPPEMVAALAADVAGRAPGVLGADLGACDAFDVLARLSEIRAPSLVVCGEADRLTPPKYATFLAGALSGARLLLVPGAGHMILAEEPAVLASAASTFLATIG